MFIVCIDINLYLFYHLFMNQGNRENWDSRPAFILAAIGSAVGLGNIWRFPYIAYKYGGGAFLIPYIVALFTAGIPLLILEFSLGHKTEKAAPNAFSSFNKKTKWIGWWAVLIGMCIVVYYAVIMSWSLIYLGKSFTLAWGNTPDTHFFNNVLHLSKSPSNIGMVVLPILIGLIAVWFWIYFSIIKGVKSVGKIVYVTVIFPWIILIILIIRGVTLPGAMNGLSYLFTPNFAALRSPEVWINAYSQIFFSTSIGFGIMIAYASYLPRKADIINNAFLIGLANSATSLLASIAIFSTLGYLSLQKGIPVANVVASGPGLAFVTYPAIINLFPFAREIFGVLFFIMLLTLGIDSAFSLVEAFSSAALEKWKISRPMMNFAIGVIAIVLGILFTTNSGLYWLDIVDHYLSVYGLIIIVILECLVVGYIIGPSVLRKYANNQSDFSIGKWWDILIKFFIPIILLVIMIWNIKNEIINPYGEYSRGALLIGMFVLIATLIIAIILSIKRRKFRGVE